MKYIFIYLFIRICYVGVIPTTDLSSLIIPFWSSKSTQGHHNQLIKSPTQSKSLFDQRFPIN